MQLSFVRSFSSPDECRFRPLLANAIALSCAAVLLVEPPIGGDLVETLAAAWLASLAAGLFATALRCGAVQDFVLQALAAAAAGAAIWFSHSLGLFQPAFFAALVLACVAAPLPALKNAESYWVWIEKFCFSAQIALLGAAVSWASVYATISSAELLFHFHDQISQGPTIRGAANFLFFGVAPIVLAAHLPAVEEIGLGAGENDLLRRGVTAVANWALAPFVLIYSVLLWTYAGKIALAGSLPMGEVGKMVGAFGFSVLAAIALVFPERSSGPGHVRLLWRNWPYLLPAPLVLLAFAVAERIGAYGLTPDRYVAAVLAALCAANGIVALGGRERVIRFAPAAAALALLAASLGPFGAIETSLRWQAASARSILAAHDALKNGRIDESDDPIALSEAETKKWLAARDTLQRYGRWSSLFESSAQSAWTAQQALQARLRLAEHPLGGASKFLSAAAASSWVANEDLLGDARIVARIVSYGPRAETVHAPGADDPSVSLRYELKGAGLLVEAPGRARSTFDLFDLASHLEKRDGLRLPQIVKASEGAGDLVLLVEALTIRIDDSDRSTTHLNAVLLAIR